VAETLDVTETVAENVRRARSYGRSRLLLLVSADNCPGCSRLDDQLKQDGLRQALLEGTYVCQLKVGDLYDDPPAALTIGAATLRSPGFPTCWLWDVHESELHFVALALGPLSDHAPEEDLSRLLAGSSYRVPEAAGITIRVELPTGQQVLDESNDFWAELALALPTPGDEARRP